MVMEIKIGGIYHKNRTQRYLKVMHTYRLDGKTRVRMIDIKTDREEVYLEEDIPKWFTYQDYNALAKALGSSL